MIETAVMDLLHATPSVVERISAPASGERQYLGAIGAGNPTVGGALVFRHIATERDYGVSGPAGDKFTTISIRSKDKTPQEATSLAELVAAVLEPYQGLAGDYVICSVQIVNEHKEYERPADASDDWQPSDIRDYRIHHTTPALE